MELIYSFLPGVAEMANIHPLLVHFPIAFLNGFLLMEVLGFIFKKDEFRTAARWMLYLGTLGVIVAVMAGLRAEATLPHTEAIHEIVLSHRKFGITVLFLSALLSGWLIFRERVFKGPERVVHMLLGAIMLGIMAFGADMGGLMVYKHGAGVKAVPVAEGHDHGGGGHHGEADMVVEGHDHAGGAHHDVDAPDSFKEAKPPDMVPSRDGLPVIANDGDGEKKGEESEHSDHPHPAGKSVHPRRDGHHDIKPLHEGGEPGHHHGG